MTLGDAQRRRERDGPRVRRVREAPSAVLELEYEQRIEGRGQLVARRGVGGGRRRRAEREERRDDQRGNGARDAGDHARRGPAQAQEYFGFRFSTNDRIASRPSGLSAVIAITSDA